MFSIYIGQEHVFVFLGQPFCFSHRLGICGKTFNISVSLECALGPAVMRQDLQQGGFDRLEALQA